ncbi:aspartate/glutamate racemase family protein [Pontivivens insulae]|uniref:Aspartate racemase n=1 Tax=Pontivivens insulae TaxID=1639689 RepID=A0A2R8A943_9RHOB|nr:amino acid racemase [Pontivivens insulae]RED18851.1 aspartate racemase [Pontivivens insulae]SPF28751.1 Aspartate racemase [Pontivivens insulae]
MKRAVGILGGMGPAATIDLMQRVIAAVDGADDADHVPLIVHQNSQVPSRIAAIVEGRGEDPGPVLARMTRDLERAGALALAMPCNTAHAYAPAIRAAATVPFIDMVALSADHASRLPQVARMGLLGSPALARASVYDAPLAARGLSAVHPRHEALELVRDVKARGVHEAARTQLRTLATHLRDDGADAIAISCSEFSLLADALAEFDIPVFDTIDLLVAEIVRFSLNTAVPEPGSTDGSSARVAEVADET